MSTIATVPDKPKQLTLKQHLQSPEFAAEIAKALPAHCKPERMIRVAMTALTRMPKLANCTQASFFKCMLDLSQWGLEPDGRRAHLIPYENKRAQTTECQLIIDYKGLVELCYRSGVVKNIHADVVRTGDIFRYSMGKVLEHVPYFLRTDEDKPAEEGNVFAVYCTIELKGDTTKTEVMSLDEVLGIRNRSQGYQSFVKGYTKTNPWESDTGEMCKKTVFRRASKWIPLSADIRDAFEHDDDLVEAVSVSRSRPAAAPISDIGAMLLGNEGADGGFIEGELVDSDADQGVELHPDVIDAFAACTTPRQVLDAQESANTRHAETDAHRAAINELAKQTSERIKAAKAGGK